LASLIALLSTEQRKRAVEGIKLLAEASRQLALQSKTRVRLRRKK
jgi:hypothetical protein